MIWPIEIIQILCVIYLRWNLTVEPLLWLYLDERKKCALFLGWAIELRLKFMGCLEFIWRHCNTSIHCLHMNTLGFSLIFFRLLWNCCFADGFFQLFKTCVLGSDYKHLHFKFKMNFSISTEEDINCGERSSFTIFIVFDKWINNY